MKSCMQLHISVAQGDQPPALVDRFLINLEPYYELRPDELSGFLRSHTRILALSDRIHPIGVDTHLHNRFPVLRGRLDGLAQFGFLNKQEEQEFNDI